MYVYMQDGGLWRVSGRVEGTDRAAVDTPGADGQPVRARPRVRVCRAACGRCMWPVHVAGARLARHNG